MTRLLLFLLCAILPACSSLPAAVKSFNAAALPRIQTDAKVAATAAAAGAASETASQLQTGGALNPTAIGTAAAVQAVAALVNLDVQRAQATQP